MATRKKAGENQANDKPVKLLRNGATPDIGKATQFKPGQSGNPAGLPKGFKHISTHIRELLEDEEFEGFIVNNTGGMTEYKGKPIKAILRAMAIKAMSGDARAFEALSKYGYGTTVEVKGLEAAPIEAVVRFVDAGQPSTN